MAAIMLTRVTVLLSTLRGAAVVPGWEVDYEGRVIATYAEETDGRLTQVSSSHLDSQLRILGSSHAVHGGFASLAAMREGYIEGARLWEAERALGAPFPRRRVER